MQGVYKQELQEAYGITFNSLFCLNNMPIKRYADYLLRRRELQSYMQVEELYSAFISPLDAFLLASCFQDQKRTAYVSITFTLDILKQCSVSSGKNGLVRMSKQLITSYSYQKALTMQLLVNNFNSGAANEVMCRSTVSVGWDGRVYDCDFNQQLAMGMR